MKIVEAVHAGGCGFESRPPRSYKKVRLHVGLFCDCKGLEDALHYKVKE